MRAMRCDAMWGLLAAYEVYVTCGLSILEQVRSDVI